MRKTTTTTAPGADRSPSVLVVMVVLRVQVVLQLKLDGAQRWDILQYIAEKELLGEPPWTMAANQKPLCERQIC